MIPVEPNGKQHCECECHPDWSWLNFGDIRGFNFTDIDGLFLVERRGCFLFVEWKAPGDGLPTGQRLALEALSYLSAFTVVQVRGTRGAPMQVRRVHRGHWKHWELTDRPDFQRRVDRWFDLVQGGPPMIRRRV